MDTPLRGVEQAAAIRKAIGFPFAVDLLVRTPEQVADRLAMGDTFIKEILIKGMVLYEAPRPVGERGESRLRIRV